MGSHLTYSLSMHFWNKTERETNYIIMWCMWLGGLKGAWLAVYLHSYISYKDSTIKYIYQPSLFSIQNKVWVLRRYMQWDNEAVDYKYRWSCTGQWRCMITCHRSLVWHPGKVATLLPQHCWPAGGLVQGTPQPFLLHQDLQDPHKQ